MRDCVNSVQPSLTQWLNNFPCFDFCWTLRWYPTEQHAFLAQASKQINREKRKKEGGQKKITQQKMPAIQLSFLVSKRGYF